MNALAIIEEVDRLAQREWWPGFSPSSIPAAIYDGAHTWLFRHPDPPSEFAPLQSGISRYEGLHHSVRANSFVNLNGVSTATLMLQGKPDSLTKLASFVIHEMFHVFQSKHHPDWISKPMELFVYPVDHTEHLALRRLETIALKRALAASDHETAAAWAAAAVRIRHERYAFLPAGSIGFERGTELLEGLASYIEFSAIGNPIPPLPEHDFSPENVRNRCYATGHAMAVMLDRLQPDWKNQVGSGQPISLDELLQSAISPHPIPAAVFSRLEYDAALSAAERDIRDLHERRAAMRRDFFALPGWRCRLEICGEHPLWPRGIDPMNVYQLSLREVLHTRWIRLSNDFGSVEMLNGQALTESAGRHPLFEGVRKVVIAGLQSKPSVTFSGDAVAIQADGLVGKFEKSDQIRIAVEASSPSGG